jgi:hypothetical protein
MRSYRGYERSIIEGGHAGGILAFMSAKSQQFQQLALDIIDDIGADHPRLIEAGIIQRLIRMTYQSTDVATQTRCLSLLSRIQEAGRLTDYLIERKEPDLFDFYTVKMSPKHVHSTLEISNSGQTVTAVGKMKKGWRTAIADKPVVGVKSWEISLDRCTSTGNIMVGVCQQDHPLGTYIGQSVSPKGWSYYGATSGYIYHDGLCNPNYGVRMRQGQIIGVTLDTLAGTLSFSVNGKPLGVAFSTGLQGMELYPAVSLYDHGDQVTFRDAPSSSTPHHTAGSASSQQQDSLLDPKTATCINGWIGEHPQQKWKLAYKASEHGWSSTEFHARCDRQGPTITIIRVRFHSVLYCS